MQIKASLVGWSLLLCTGTALGQTTYTQWVVIDDSISIASPPLLAAGKKHTVVPAIRPQYISGFSLSFPDPVLGYCLGASSYFYLSLYSSSTSPSYYDQFQLQFADGYLVTGDPVGFHLNCGTTCDPGYYLVPSAYEVCSLSNPMVPLSVDRSAFNISVGLTYGADNEYIPGGKIIFLGSGSGPGYLGYTYSISGSPSAGPLNFPQTCDLAENTSFLTGTTVQSALQASSLVYNPNGYLAGYIVQHTDETTFGYRGRIYEDDAHSTIIIAYRGTDYPIWQLFGIGNILVDLGFSGFLTTALNAELSDAVGTYNYAKQLCPTCRIVLTGHSLGGGVAQLIGAVTGDPTITFNAAPTATVAPSVIPTISSMIPGNKTPPLTYDSNIVNIGVQGELLSKLSFGQLGATVTVESDAFGSGYGSYTQPLPSNPLVDGYRLYHNHIMDTVLNQMVAPNIVSDARGTCAQTGTPTNFTDANLNANYKRANSVTTTSKPDGSTSEIRTFQYPFNEVMPFDPIRAYTWTINVSGSTIASVVFPGLRTSGRAGSLYVYSLSNQNKVLIGTLTPLQAFVVPVGISSLYVVDPEFDPSEVVDEFPVELKFNNLGANAVTIESVRLATRPDEVFLDGFEQQILQ